MGVFSEWFGKMFGKTNETLMLEEPTIRENENKDENKSIKVAYFPKVKDKQLQHEVQIIQDGKKIRIGTLYSNKEKTEEQQADMSIREIASDLQIMLTSLNNAENINGLNSLKEKAKSQLEEITANNSTFVLDKEIIEFIDDFEPEQLINYQKLDELPKKVDIDKLTPSLRKIIAEKVQTRMKRLETITTPDLAWEDREKIISFIQSIEHLPLNPIIDANTESEEKGIELDEETIKLIAKNMENIPNEDGALYSVYLKIEEKRIWKKIKLTIAQHANNIQKEALDNLFEGIGKLNIYELHDIEGGFSTEILNYIIDEINEMDTEKYINEIKSVDSLLARIIVSNFPDMDGKDKMLPFFYSRIASLGQLSNREGNPLRKFIETTDFKDEDNTESKEFLLLAAQVEKNYFKNQFRDFLEYSIEKSEDGKNNFKERLSATSSIYHHDKLEHETIAEIEKNEEIKSNEGITKE